MLRFFLLFFGSIKFRFLLPLHRQVFCRITICFINFWRCFSFFGFRFFNLHFVIFLISLLLPLIIFPLFFSFFPFDFLLNFWRCLFLVHAHTTFTFLGVRFK